MIENGIKETMFCTREVNRVWLHSWHPNSFVTSLTQKYTPRSLFCVVLLIQPYRLLNTLTYTTHSTFNEYVTKDICIDVSIFCWNLERNSLFHFIVLMWLCDHRNMTGNLTRVCVCATEKPRGCTLRARLMNWNSRNVKGN